MIRYSIHYALPSQPEPCGCEWWIFSMVCPICGAMTTLDESWEDPMFSPAWPK